MFKKSMIVVSALSVVFVNCGSQDSSGQSAKPGAPVETKEANTKYKPAFEGQTRIKGVKTSTPYTFNVISKDLKYPWGITSLPDGRLLINEKGGTMRIAKTTGELSAPITGIPQVNPAGQGGLLGLTIDPEFTKNRIVYWAFSEKTNGGNLTAVAKGTLSADETKIENAKVKSAYADSPFV